MQGHLTLIPHRLQGDVIYQRPSDGYINATAMCQAAGKRWSGYRRLDTTTAFIEALSSDVQIHTAELIQSVSGGIPELQGTWVHPQVAVNLATWCSPEFAVKVSRWVVDWLSGKAPKEKAELPCHIRRHIANHNNVPSGHFSILSEMTILLIGPMESMGYTLPERMLPDISMGRMFCKWLRVKYNVDTNDLPTYWHVYEDGRRIQAKAYPETMLSAFRKPFREDWLNTRAIGYFRERDSEALSYLPLLISGPKKAA